MKNFLLSFSLLLLSFFNISAQDTIRIVCIGNSISQGKYEGSATLNQKSYRPFLWQKLDSIGLNVKMVGYNPYWFTEGTDLVNVSYQVPTPVSPHTGHTFPRYHECYYGINTQGFVDGISGGGHPTIPAFSTRIQKYNPDIALIHIGTNGDSGGDATKVTNIKSIISTLRSKNPNVKICLAKLIDNWNTLNALIPGIITDMSTAQSPIILVDQTVGFINDSADPNTDTWDWVHPNDKGCKKMADKWFAAILKNFVADAVVPSKPLSLAASNITVSSIDLKWNASTDNIAVSKYYIYKNGVIADSSTSTSYTAKSLNSNTTYNFYVVAKDYVGNASLQSDPVSPKTTLNQWIITFIIKDNAAALMAGASVNYNSETKITDATGKAIFNVNDNSSPITYTVTMSTFQNATGTIIPNHNTTKNITMQKAASDEIIISDAIDFYPNPSFGYINIVKANDYSFEIYNVLGILKKSGKITSDKEYIDLSNFSGGDYFIKFIKNDAIITKKLSLIK